MLRRNAPLLVVAILLAGCGYSLGDIDLLDPQPDPFSSEAYNFAVIGDWGRAGWFRQDNVAHAMAEECADVKCRFVASTGDNFYIDGVESVDDPKWDRSYENVYTASSLNVPWYVVLGNHDYLGDVQAQISYTEESDRWTLPSRYYSTEVHIDDTTSALFAFLDTVPLVTNSERASTQYVDQAEWERERQLTWLDSTLAASDADWRFVFGHHPVVSASAKHSDSPRLRGDLDPILTRRDVDVYVSGHVHSLQHLRTENGLDYVVSGGGSLARKVGTHPAELFAAGVSGFAMFSVTPTEIGVQFVDFRGNVGYEGRITPGDGSV